MIRHDVAHHFWAACGRSSQHAALLDPGEALSLSLRDEPRILPQSKKPTIRSVYQSVRLVGIDRAIPGGRPLVVQAGYPARLPNRVRTEPPIIG